GAGNAGYGAVVAAWGFGVAFAVAILARRLRPEGLAPVVLVAAVAVNLAYVVAAGVAGLLATELAFFAGGMANGVGLIAMRTLLHQRAPRSARGRAFAAYGGLVTASQIAALGAGGVLVQVLGARTTLFLAGGAGTAVAGAGIVVYAGSARAPRTS